MNESTGTNKIILAALGTGMLILAVFVVLLFIRTSGQPSSPDTEAEVNSHQQSLYNASPVDVIDRYYKAVRDRYYGIIIDELVTTQFAERLNKAMNSGGIFEGKIANIGPQAEWQVLEIKGLDYSNFQIALIQYTNESETFCERLELADPGTTGDHWRIARSYAVSCQSGEELAQQATAIPTQDNTVVIVATAMPNLPTATTEVGLEYDVPEINWSPCEVSYSSRLIVGMAAMVNTDPPVPNRVREAAGLQYKVLGEMQPGEEMRIVDGPKCADEWVWWKVSSLQSGLTGWTSEGTWGEYWLIPSRPPGF